MPNDQKPPEERWIDPEYYRKHAYVEWTPDPKPPAGYDSHLSYCLNASTSIVPVDEWKLAVAELDILRADAKAYRFLCKQNIKALRHLERDIETGRRETEPTTKGIER